ncbi:MAG: hypothetical protein PV344_01220, partial [Anaplasma sp.]|nr:hypothetical protein [Anaplasma sp.]
NKKRMMCVLTAFEQLPSGQNRKLAMRHRRMSPNVTHIRRAYNCMALKRAVVFLSDGPNKA